VAHERIREMAIKSMSFIDVIEELGPEWNDGINNSARILNNARLRATKER